MEKTRILFMATSFIVAPVLTACDPIPDRIGPNNTSPGNATPLQSLTICVDHDSKAHCEWVFENPNKFVFKEPDGKICVQATTNGCVKAPALTKELVKHHLLRPSEVEAWLGSHPKS